MSAYKKMILILDPEEDSALNHVSRENLRRPRDQARYILRQALGLTNDNGPVAQMNNRQAAKFVQDQSSKAVVA